MQVEQHDSQSCFKNKGGTDSQNKVMTSQKVLLYLIIVLLSLGLICLLFPKDADIGGDFFFFLFRICRC